MSHIQQILILKIHKKTLKRHSISVYKVMFAMKLSGSRGEKETPYGQCLSKQSEPLKGEKSQTLSHGANSPVNVPALFGPEITRKLPVF